MGLELTSYIQAADDLKCTYSPAEHSALSEIVSLVKISHSSHVDTISTLVWKFQNLMINIFWQWCWLRLRYLFIGACLIGNLKAAGNLLPFPDLSRKIEGDSVCRVLQNVKICKFLQFDEENWKKTTGLCPKSWFLAKPTWNLWLPWQCQKWQTHNWHKKISIEDKGTATESFSPID